ncbi:MAG: tetratricopeptide repeat protein, partial [Tepidisphaeraceae bacterium]
VRGWSNFGDYVDLIRSFDIALDPFPFNGGTTTCHLFWYGAPIVTLAGERQVSRMGVSLLHAIGLGELVAQTPEQYVQKAAALAGDVPRLREIRHSLRRRMLDSPLCDARGYTRSLEAAFRQMWTTYCTE